MKCSKCKENRATIHIDQFQNGKYIFIDICEDCALKEGLIPQQADITQLLEEAIEKIFVKKSAEAERYPPKEGIRKTSAIFRKVKVKDSVTCSECGITLEELDNTKLLGCPNDYNVFRNEIIARLKRTNVHTKFEGQMPAVNRVEGTIRLEIRKLKTDMKNAISMEDYETAAQIRDKIIALETKLKDN